MRAVLKARQLSNDQQTTYGIQWIGSQLYIFSMYRLQEDNYVGLTKVYEGSISVSVAEVMQAMLALRSLICKQRELEKTLPQPRRTDLQILATPTVCTSF